MYSQVLVIGLYNGVWCGVWLQYGGGCPKEWAARIESKPLCIYIWGPSKFCSLAVELR
jgi:hypothetical protein